MQPSNIQVFELMCWCWSDLPIYRPDFNTILSVLKTDVFTRLLASFPLTGNKEEVTTSCLNQIKSPRITSSSTANIEPSISLSIVSNSISSKTSDGFRTQIWYGTDFGKYGIVNFQNNVITHEVNFY